MQTIRLAVIVSCLSFIGCKRSGIPEDSQQLQRSVSMTDLTFFQARHADMPIPDLIIIDSLDEERHLVAGTSSYPFTVACQWFALQAELLGWGEIQLAANGHHALFSCVKKDRTLCAHLEKRGDRTNICLSYTTGSEKKKSPRQHDDDEGDD